MKLERLDVWTSNGEECKQYISDGEFVEWTPELQEAWDKQQEQQVIEYKQGLKTECPICKSNVDENYCPNCGQKLKWY